MSSIKFNHWYANKNSLSISLMRFHAEIKMLVCSNDIIYKLTITDSDRKVLVLNYNSLDEAITFTETVVANCSSLCEIISTDHKNLKRSKK